MLLKDNLNSNFLNLLFEPCILTKSGIFFKKILFIVLKLVAKTLRMKNHTGKSNSLCFKKRKTLD